jgi:hypothetical protein
LLEIVAAAVAVKVAVVADALTATKAGTVSWPLLLFSVTFDPPAGAGWLNATVQVLAALCPRLVGLQTTEEIAGTETIAPVAPDNAIAAPVPSTPSDSIRPIEFVAALLTNVT